MTDFPPVWAFLGGVALVAWLTTGAMAVRFVSRIWLRHWAERRLRGAAAAATYLERPHRLLMAASAMISLVVTLLGLEVSLWPHAGAAQLLAIVAMAAFVVLLFGQILPRVIARRWAASLVPFTVPALHAAVFLTAPLLALGRVAGRRFAPRTASGEVVTPRDPIGDLLREGELEGVGERGEIEIITGVVAFGAKTVRDVMMPRETIFALPHAMEPETLARAIAESGYSRVPIYGESLDDLLGMVHAFDVLKRRGGIRPPLRPVLDASPERPCSELLFQMLRRRSHLALVRDGAHVVGLVTLEDVLEELVGDIRDEHDEHEEQEPTTPGAVIGAAPPSIEAGGAQSTAGTDGVIMPLRVNR